MHLVTLATSRRPGRAALRDHPRPAAILHALDLPEPPRFFDFTSPTSTEPPVWPAAPV